MINRYAVGFVLVAAGVALGADYVTQSRRAGAAPGELALAEYLRGYSLRFGGTVAVIAKTRRQARPAREHLPEVAAGWQRRDWVRDAAGDEAAMTGMGLIERRDYKAGVKAARKAAREEVYEYVRGAERVRLSARFEPRPDAGERPGRVTAFVAPGVDVGAARLQGFDIVQGVVFFRLTGPATGPGANPDGPVMLQAWLGDGVAIGVYAERPVEGLPALLEAIDYDGLNAMLDEPAGLVGSAAPPVPEDQKARFLKLAAGAYMNDPAIRGAAAARPARDGGGQVLSQRRPAGTVSRLKPGTAGGDGPGRLTLSGGRSCLGASARLCD